MQRLNILVIPAYKLFPIDSGGAHHQLVFLSRQQYQHSIHLLVTPKNLPGKHLHEFQKLFPAIKLIPIGYENKGLFSSWMGFLKKQYRKLSKKRFPYNYPKVKELQNLVLRDHQFIDAVKNARLTVYDVIQVEHTINMGLVEVLPPGILRIFVHHEISHERIKSDLLAQERKPADIKTLSDRAEKMEMRWLNMYDAVITLSERDRELLQQKGLTKPVQVARPFAYFEGEIERAYDSSGSPRLVFAGGGTHFPNREGLSWFVQEVWPQIKNKFPNLFLAVTGDWPADFKSQFAAEDRIEFTGFVTDLKSLFTNAIMIIPVRIGSGVRIKAISALGNAVPIVSTTLGVSGIPGLIHAENVLIADTASEFVSAISNLITNPVLRKTISERGFALAEQEYQGAAFADERSRFYEELLLQNRK